MMTFTRTRDERGFSMFLVIMAMFVTSMFVAAGFAAANGDLPMSGKSKDRKLAYAAAEAGLNFYQQRLDQNPDYWTLCNTGPKPNTTENNPVNQQWTSGATDPRLWRNLPEGSTAQYTIELLPAPGSGYTQCDKNHQESMLDMKTGTFRVRVTGRAYPKDPQRRSIVATFRRKGFLDFLWFTDFEDFDPQAEATQSTRDQRSRDCADKYRGDRAGVTCTEISFITPDAMHGPMHSNDSFQYCGSPQWGDNKTHKIESSAPDPGMVQAAGTCGPGPNILGVFKAGATSLKMPDTNASLEAAAVSTGYVYKGKTVIRFNNDGTMRVTYMDPTDATFTRTISATVQQPSNGVIYVKSGGASACVQDPPPAADYDEPNSCGNVYVSGTYTRSMTIAADSDLIVSPTANDSATAPKSNDGSLVRPAGNDSMMGLIANNFVRVGHACNRSTSTNIDTTNRPLVTNPKIQAAILSLAHSFIADNHACGAPLGNLTVEGAISQKYRGTVGTHSNGVVKSGFAKDYHYDERLRFRSPPYFIDPVRAAWGVIKVTEQVPAR
jgi:Tfp pilus assembly protein PilX